MIVIPRELARSIRALARKCVSGRHRGPAPPVVFACEDGGGSASVRTADAVLVYSGPTVRGDGAVVVPAGVLDAAAGAGDDLVELAAAGPRGEARWADRGVPRVHRFDATPDGPEAHPPAAPADWHPAPRGLLAALHECGRTTARDGGGRYALDRVQVRGAAGQVIGTDGRAALIRCGFVFPFAADLLVPAVPVFGAKELTREPVVRIGHTPRELAVAAGPWRVHLPVAPGGRFPDVAGVVPRSCPTAAKIDTRDAADLLAALPGLPGADAEHHPVTLDLDGGVVVRGRDDATGAVRDVRLPRSSAAGPPARVVVDRGFLSRALALGCYAVRVAPGKAVAFEGADSTLVVVALDPSPAATPPPASEHHPTTSIERSSAVRDDTTDHSPDGRADAPAADLPDPLTAAEELRAAVADALTKAGRLVAALKTRRREQKALTQVWSSLKALNLGPGGQP